MTPEHKFAFLMWVLFLAFPAAFFAIKIFYRFFVCDTVFPQLAYNKLWEFSPVRKTLFSEQQK